MLRSIDVQRDATGAEAGAPFFNVSPPGTQRMWSGNPLSGVAAHPRIASVCTPSGLYRLV